MKNGIIIDEQKSLEFVGAVQLSMGCGMQLDSRFSNDYSKRPQSVVRRKKTQARTATVNLQVVRSGLDPEMNLFDVVSAFEQIVGQTGDLYWNSANEGSFCVRSASFSFALDAVDIATAAQITLELTEGYKKPDSTPNKTRQNVVVQLI